jgi:hypothetical protein
MKIERAMSRVMAPVGAYCKLCELSADPGDGGGVRGFVSLA